MHIELENHLCPKALHNHPIRVFSPSLLILLIHIRRRFLPRCCQQRNLVKLEIPLVGFIFIGIFHYYEYLSFSLNISLPTIIKLKDESFYKHHPTTVYSFHYYAIYIIEPLIESPAHIPYL